MVSYNLKVYIVWLVRELLYLWEDGCEYEPPLNIVYKNLVSFVWLVRELLYLWEDGCEYEPPLDIVYKNLVTFVDVRGV